MTRKEYYKRLTEGVNSNFAEYQSKKTEYDKLTQDKKSGEYTADYIAKEITPKQYALKQAMDSIQKKASNDVKELTEEMRIHLRGLDALNPNEITDDVKILNSGVKLTKNDLQSIIDKNPTNRTMTQLALRYASENNIDMGLTYNNAESEMKTYESIEQVANVVIKWFDNASGFNSMNTRLLGDASDIAAICNDD